MATRLHTGARVFEMDRDEEGHRNYKVTHLVEADTTDGPYNVLATAGLPTPGTLWTFFNDVDSWAFCKATASVRRHRTPEGQKGKWWAVTQDFSTKIESQRCQDRAIENPLLEPQKVSGSSIKYTEEATEDRHGNPLVNSAFEQLRGPQVEFDRNRAQVVIEQNVAVLQLALCTSLVDSVNDAPLWGLGERTIKLSDFQWERLYYGQCFAYYRRKLTFDVNFDGWDREALDEGTKMLSGTWSEANPPTYAADAWADSGNPAHFVRATDRPGNPIKVVLKNGVPVTAKMLGYITDATNAEPIVITSAAHGLTTGKRVSVYDVEGNTAANGSWTITNLTANTFSLDTSKGNGVYTANTGYWRNTTPADQPGSISIEKYESANLLQLSIPTVL